LIFLWDVKEPTHYSGDPGAFGCLSANGGVGEVGHLRVKHGTLKSSCALSLWATVNSAQ